MATLKSALYVPPPDKEQHYLNLLLDPLDASANYKPKFGTDEAEGVSLDQFKIMYGQDPFYHGVGLDSELVYAAHKAAGGMTSIYRQLGAGCDSLFRAVIQDALLLSDEEVAWSYRYKKKDKTIGIAKLDARIDISHMTHQAEARARVVAWLAKCGQYLELSDERVRQLRGAIFEARQGYKSADAKRANADLQFAMNASSQNYLPVLSIVSTQASRSVIRRYKNAKMLVMAGVLSDAETTSTYAFFRNIVGFELDAFFKRNTETMRRRCRNVLEAIISPA